MGAEWRGFRGRSPRAGVDVRGRGGVDAADGWRTRIAGMPDPASPNDLPPTDAPARDAAPSSRVFLRLVRLLRPYWPLIGLGLLLLLLSVPCELFPAIVWRY